MKKFNVLKKLIIFLTLLLVSGFVNGQILVSGTEFDPLPANATNFYIGLSDIAQIGLQPGNITTTPVVAPNVNTGIFYPSSYYAITPDPNRLDNANKYIDLSATPDYMYVYAGNASNGNILQYSLTGMQPGATIRVDIEYVNVIRPGTAGCNVGEMSSFKVGINKDQYNQLNGTEVPQRTYGLTGTVSTTDGGAVVDASGNIVVRINSQQSPNSCRAMGIKSIKIYSTPAPTIISTSGNQPCAGEQVTLQTLLQYNGTYQWQVDDGSGTFVSIAGGTNQALLYELANTAKTYKFRAMVTPAGGGSPIVSNVVTLTSIVCCEDPVTHVGSGRKTIYYDDFGTLDLIADPTGKTYKAWDYTDVLNPVLVTKTTPIPFRWQLSPAPLGATFKATGPPIDGEYVVASYLTGYGTTQGALLEWAANVGGLATQPTLSYDHSGAKEGAALFINCPTGSQGSVIYSKPINNLCFGKLLTFECWINVFSNGPGPGCPGYQGANVTVKLIDGANVVTIPGVSVTRQQDGGTGWVKVTGNITLGAGSTSVVMQVINNSAASTCGNDLVIDDIKIMACAPPPLALYFDLPTLLTHEEVCSSPMDLNVKPSALLNSFYGGSPKFLYQWSRTPTVVTSWTNLAVPQAGQTFAIANPQLHAAYATLVDGDKVYFRAVAATDAIFVAKNNFTGANYANDNDPCKNYSVSNVIESVVKCPTCSKPTSVTITPATQSLCVGNTLTITGVVAFPATPPTGTYRYTWYKASNPANIIAGPFTTNTNFLKTNVSTADADTYTLRVEDYTVPGGVASCYREASVVVTVTPIPTISGTLTVCQGLTTTLTGTGTAHATTPWASATPAVATVSNTGIVTGVSAGTSVITYMVSAGCTQTATVTVNAKPTIGGTLTVCQGLTTTLTGTATAHGTTPWASATPAVATVSNTGVVTGVSAGTSVITYMNSNGCIETATVTVNAKPTIGGTLSVCQGLTRTLTGTGTPHATTPWASATPAVATVSNTGVVTGVSAGTSVITYMTSAGCTETATITVSAIPTISGTLTVCQSLTTTLTGTGTPHATTPWASATPAVATVSNTGIVTGVSAGTSVITYMVSAGCTQTATVTVIAKPTIGGTLTVCQGLTTTLTGTATAHGTTPWASATPAVATVSNTGVVTGVSAGTSVITYMNSNNCIETATVTVSGTPTIGGTLSVCQGLTRTLTGTGTPHATTPWASATPAVATVSNTGIVTGVSTGTSVITYMTSAGCTQTATVTVNASPVPGVTIATPSTTICTGTSITFTATPTNGGTPTYQWYKGTAPTGTSLGAASTNNTYTTATAANGDSYYVVMTSTANCVSPATATSNAVVITVTTVVTPAVTITAAPGNTICAGTSVTFTAVGGNGGLAPTYEWFIGSTSQGPASSATGADQFTSTTLANNDQIKVIMTSNSGCVIAPGTATSNVITMTVNPVLVPAVAITVSPTGAICPGTSITFTAAPTNGGTPTYQWFKGPAGSGTSLGATATNATYTTTTAANNDSYYVVMTSTVTCATPAIVTSNAIAITVTPVPTLAVSIVSDVTSICANNPVQFTATASGTGSTPAPTYEWFVTSAATATGGTSQGVASTTATTFTTSALTAANNKVYVQVVSNAACAATTPVASNVIAITVNAGIGAGTIGSDQTICYNGTPVSITETAVPTATAGSLSYVWQETATPTVALSWQTATTGAPVNGGKDFTASGTFTQDMYYRRIVTDAGTPAPCNVATSNTVHITVRPQLVAGVIGSDETICSGSVPAVMTETTAPTGGTGTFTYQWESDAATVGVFLPIGSAATNSSYTSTALIRTTQFRRVETSGTCGSVTSNIVTKTISAPEVVTVSINDPGQVCDGSAAFAFVATAATTGTGTLSYAWSLVDPSTGGSTPIGANSANDSYSPLIGDHTKLIQVVVTTSNGCNAGPATASVPLDIVAAATPTVTITTNNNPNCAGLISTFTATSTAAGSNPTYQWYVVSAGSPAGTPGTAVVTGGVTFSSSTLANGDRVYVELTSSLVCLIGTNPFKSNEITMVIKPIPAPAITEGDQTICTPNSFTFHGIVTAGNTYEWRDLSSNTVVGTSPDFTASQSGTYVLFEDNGTCNSTSQPVTLNIVQTPIANAGTDIYIKEGDAGSLNGSGGAVYSWSPSTYLSDASVSNPGFTATETITYTLTVSDATNTCSTTDNVTVTVVSPIIVPNVITVNGDGSNDDWYLENIEGYPNCIIEIYNRWGNLVWKSEGYPKNWDGTNFRNGQVLSDGTYFYVINLQSQIYDEPLTGWVQIIK